jgi:hypothetical protein
VQKKRELEEMEKHIRRESQKVDDEMRMLSQEGADQWRGAAEAHEVSNYGERGCGLVIMGIALPLRGWLPATDVSVSISLTHDVDT